MKYRKKFIIFNLLAGLTALTISCSRQQPVLQLVNTAELNFPSASAIEFYQKRIYLFGDDATHLLVLDPAYRAVDSVSYWSNSVPRIPKRIKPDIESCFIRNENNKPILTALGSMSDVNRWKVIRYDFDTRHLDTTSYFLTEDDLAGISQPNIEGSTLVNTNLILANRANLSNPVNHLVFCQSSKIKKIKTLVLPKQNNVAGLSGLFYVKEKDLLLFTATEEATESTTADGAIGESYLGGIENFSKRMNEDALRPDFFHPLSTADQRLRKQKIESVCVEKISGNVLTLHLAADNDNGKSQLFKFLFRWEAKD